MPSVSRTCLLGLALMEGRAMATAIPPQHLVHGVLASDSQPAMRDEDLNSAADEDSTLLKRQHTKPEWMIARRKAHWHLQQLAAGQKIDVDEMEKDIDILMGAGGGVDIYVFDSGIRTSYVAFAKGALDDGPDQRASNSKDTAQTTYLSQDATWDDIQGHGTHVEALVGGAKHGVAQWANLINVKGVLDAIKDVTAKYNEKKANPPRDWKGSVIKPVPWSRYQGQQCSEESSRNGMRLGHPDSHCRREQGTSDEGKSLKAGGVSWRVQAHHLYWKAGPNVDIWAPGSGLVSADNKNDKATKYRTGTSMACPLVAGIMATIVGYEGPLHEEGKTTQFVYDRLMNNALKGVMPSLAAAEVNAFAQTGINSPKDNEEYRTEPYPGIDHNYIDIENPYGRKRKTTEPEDGYKTTVVENEDPNDKRLNMEDGCTLLEDGGDQIPDVTGEAGDDAEKNPGQGGGKPPCEGNQICQDCEGGKLPDIKDNSGPQPPVCMKADGSPGSPARFNEQKLREAAPGYSKELVDKKRPFKEGAPTPRAPSLDGGAQNGKSMSLAALFHKNFATAIPTVCSIDSTWGDKWVKDFDVLGGVHTADCVMDSALGGRLYLRLLVTFPKYVKDFEAKWNDWQQAISAQGPSTWSSVPSFTALTTLGPKIIPLVVYQLALNENDDTAVHLYMRLETDPAYLPDDNPEEVGGSSSRAWQILKLSFNLNRAVRNAIADWTERCERVSVHSTSAMYTDCAEYDTLLDFGPRIVPHVMLQYAQDIQPSRSGVAKGPHGIGYGVLFWYELLDELVFGRRTGMMTIVFPDMYNWWETWFQGRPEAEGAPGGGDEVPAAW
ncbi:peptidase S8/S53 domain-containing protein [Apodospora peruviana]|uniref:Peptidase S8/S53 domain-containing protein n=1 Tax=Apodospora peruviana TaxID=516989 RepID=A0AAE0IEF0_9PEZI|nr:peptidase S8/S53 domain-containing protein [Apodospora peruviana]